MLDIVESVINSLDKRALIAHFEQDLEDGLF